MVDTGARYVDFSIRDDLIASAANTEPLFLLVSVLSIQVQLFKELTFTIL